MRNDYKEEQLLIKKEKKFSQPAPESPIQPSLEWFQQHIASSNRIQIDTVETKSELIQEWKKIFGDKLIEGERLVKVFRCAIAKPALLEGRIWVSDYHIVFKLNWPGQTCILMDYSSIVDIRKASFASIVPNAIEIETASECFFFGSLTARGEKFSLLKHIWDQHVHPTSLFRKYPDASAAICSCTVKKTCGYCLKLAELKKYESERRKNNKRLTESEESSIQALEEKLNSYKQDFHQKKASISLDGAEKVMDDSGEGNTTPNEIFENDLDVNIPPTVSNSSLNTLNEMSGECECTKDKDYEKVFESEIFLPLETLWKEWFCTPSVGTAFLRFLLNQQNITCLEIAPWAYPGDKSGEETVPLDRIDYESNFTPKFSSIKPGLYRKSTRVLPLKHSIPFVPKSTPGANEWSILSVTPKKLCVRNEATIYLMGIVTDLKLCLEETAPNTTLLKVYVKLIFTGKGKINVPKSLAEKGTLDGIKSFYAELTEYLMKDIEETPHSLCSCSKLGEQEGLKTMFQSDYLPISIEDVWNQLLVPIGGNAFITYVEGRAGWKDIEYSKWDLPNNFEVNFAPREKYSGCAIPYSQIQSEMSCKIRYKIVNEDPAPFVPSVMKSLTKHTIVNQTPHNICLLAETSIDDFGINSFVRICITSLGPLKTKISILGRVNVSNGKYPLPSSWKNSFDRFQLFYSDLFGHYLITSESLLESSSSKPSIKFGERHLSKDSLKKGKVNDRSKFWNLSMFPRRQYSDFVIAFLFIMLLLNTLILWNLVIAAERSQIQVNELKAQVRLLKIN